MPAIETVETTVEAVVETPAVKKAKIDDKVIAVEGVAEVETSDDDDVPVVPHLELVEDKVVKPTLRFAKLSEHARAPTRGSFVAAGYDLYAAEEMVIEPGKRACVKTDIQIEVPDGTYGRVAPRSGLAAKHGIDVGAGVVDKDYRGNVMVLLFNFGDAAFNVARGDRIAQLVLEKICMAELEELPTLDVTERGDGGFGSTGKN